MMEGSSSGGGAQRSRKSIKSSHNKDAASSASTHIARTSSHFPSSTLGMIDSMWPCKACRAADAVCE